MKDPWRIVDPLKEQLRPRPDPDKPSKIDGPGDKDMDADWQPQRSCFLRFKSCSIEVCGADLQTPRDALEKLARCIQDLWKLGHRERLNRVNVVAVSRSWVVVCSPKPRNPTTPAARLSCEDVAISFIEQTLDEGTLRLARCLIELARKPATAAVLKKHGITPMLRTT